MFPEPTMAALAFLVIPLSGSDRRECVPDCSSEIDLHGPDTGEICNESVAGRRVDCRHA